MREMLVVLAAASFFGCAIAQVTAERGQAARTAESEAINGEAARNVNGPRIQITDKREFVRELAQLGVSTSIADLDLIKKLFGWTPDFKPERDRLNATFPQQAESESNLDSINLWLVSGNLERERGGLQVRLHPTAYCIRFEDVTAALGEPQSYFRESANLWGRFKKVMTVYGANFQTSKVVVYSFLFEYQECAQRIFVTKNVK
jgi:hypothetical protein